MTNSAWHGQLSHIGLRVADALRSATFYVDVLGLSVRSTSPDGTHVRLGWPTGQHALDLFTGPRGLDHFSLEIIDPHELEEVVSSLVDAGHDVEHVSADGEQPATHAVRDPEGHLLELHGRVDRSGERSSTMARRPVRLQHITLATARMDDLLEFYVGVMGLRVSDRMGSVFTWLRCGAEHHTIAIVQSDSGDLDHFSFDVGGWEDFKAWGDHLSRYGVPLTWGPGRHGPGNNLFVMFDDPDHYHVELSSDMESYFDDLAEYQPRQWRLEPRTVNLWGPAPGWRVPRHPQPAPDSGEGLMRLASVLYDSRPAIVALRNGQHVLVREAAELGPDTPFSALLAEATRSEVVVREDDLTWRSVVPNPRRIICLGLNYRAHVEETGRALPSYPVLFTKWASSLTAAGAPVALPPESDQIDYEGELAVIIGREGRRIAPGDALDHVAGLSVANDITMRDYQHRTHQWLQGKAWDASTPLGPYLVTLDEVGDVGHLDLRLELNGEEMQSSNTELLIFDVPTTIAHISEFTTLQPGDVILTGTPGGVGARRDPQVFLKPGDVVRVEIPEVGLLENAITSEAAAQVPGGR